MGKIISKTIPSPEGGSLKINFEFNTGDRGFTMSGKSTMDQFTACFKAVTSELNDEVLREEKSHINKLMSDLIKGVLRFKDTFKKEGGAEIKTVFYEDGKIKCYVEGTKVYEYKNKECVQSYIDGVRQLILREKLF